VEVLVVYILLAVLAVHLERAAAVLLEQLEERLTPAVVVVVVMVAVALEELVDPV
jgi:hypothetical protein